MVLFLASVASVLYGQTAQPTNVQTVLELVKTLQLQQAQLVDNEGKIDAKIGDLAETIRLARIEAARMGGKHIPPSKQN